MDLIVDEILVKGVDPAQWRRRGMIAHDPKRMPYHSWFHFWIQRVDRGHEFRGEQTKMFLGKRRFHRQNGRPDPLDLFISLRTFEKDVVARHLGKIGRTDGGVEPSFEHEGRWLLFASTSRRGVRLCRLFEGIEALIAKSIVVGQITVIRRSPMLQPLVGEGRTTDRMLP